MLQNPGAPESQRFRIPELQNPRCSRILELQNPKCSRILEIQNPRAPESQSSRVPELQNPGAPESFEFQNLPESLESSESRVTLTFLEFLSLPGSKTYTLLIPFLPRFFSFFFTFAFNFIAFLVSCLRVSVRSFFQKCVSF